MQNLPSFDQYLRPKDELFHHDGSALSITWTSDAYSRISLAVVWTNDIRRFLHLSIRIHVYTYMFLALPCLAMKSLCVSSTLLPTPRTMDDRAQGRPRTPIYPAPLCGSMHQHRHRHALSLVSPLRGSYIYDLAIKSLYSTP